MVRIEPVLYEKSYLFLMVLQIDLQTNKLSNYFLFHHKLRLKAGGIVRSTGSV